MFTARYELPTQRIYVFCVDLRTNCDYFPIQNSLLVFITYTELFTARSELNQSYNRRSVFTAQ